MIPYDFAYTRPDTLSEAYAAFLKLQANKMAPVYYAGGSEIITMSRTGSMQPGAVIDIKSIPECTSITQDETGLHIGSACTLTQIKESNFFPLLTVTAGRIADHTNQCRITLGGNLCGSILYRETSLPLLLADASLTILGSQGLQTVPFQSVFTGQMQLNPGELAVQVHIPVTMLKLPHFHVKRTANEKIDYPLVTMAALLTDRFVRIAFSGICAYPFRSPEIEAVVNTTSLSSALRAEQAVSLLPAPVYQDIEGSSEYRKFVFQNTLEALIQEVNDDLL